METLEETENPAKGASALLSAIDELPGQRPVLARVTALLDDDDSSAVDVAQVLVNDAVLSARVFRLANSAYYGMSGRVRDLKFAISILGFGTIRSLTLAALAGADGDSNLPPKFWERSAACAHVAQALGPTLGIRSPETFCLALMGGIGQALMWRADPEYRTLTEGVVERSAILTIEKQQYGLTHVELSSQALSSWSLPEDLCEVLDLASSTQAPSNPQALAVRMGLEAGAVVVDNQPIPHILKKVPDAVLSRVLEEARTAAKEIASALA